MKKTLALSLLALIFPLSGCGELSTIEYNNTVAQSLDTNSSLIKDIITAYDSDIPDIVTEQTEIDTSGMESSLENTRTKYQNVETLLALTSKNPDQEKAVEQELINYISLSETCLNTYTTILDYYKSGEYKNNLELVEEYDTGIYNDYNALIESNNKLADILEEYTK